MPSRVRKRIEEAWALSAPSAMTEPMLLSVRAISSVACKMRTILAHIIAGRAVAHMKVLAWHLPARFVDHRDWTGQKIAT
jgi:hypothetical protein